MPWQIRQSYKSTYIFIVFTLVYIYFYIKWLIKRDKCKISSCGSIKLQIAPCDIKMNSKLTRVCQKNNLVHEVEFRKNI